MPAKRIIPCLDIQNGRTVKGVQFLDIRDAGDPVELAVKYSKEGADELVFLDITATNDDRGTLVDLVERIACEIDIPFTVGGGISSLPDIEKVLKAGADKVSINSAGIRNPNLFYEASRVYGSQCIVAAIDTNFVDGDWYVFSHGGRKNTGKLLIEWAREVCSLGAGEILLTSMHNDGTQQGFAIDITKKITDMLPIPVIASGGAGSKEDFLRVFQNTGAEAALAAGVFHFGKIGIPELKHYLYNHSIPIRL